MFCVFQGKPTVVAAPGQVGIIKFTGPSPVGGVNGVREKPEGEVQDVKNGTVSVESGVEKVGSGEKVKVSESSKTPVKEETKKEGAKKEGVKPGKKE